MIQTLKNQKQPKNHQCFVLPANAGIPSWHLFWTPAFAGVTELELFSMPANIGI